MNLKIPFFANQTDCVQTNPQGERYHRLGEPRSADVKMLVRSTLMQDDTVSKRVKWCDTIVGPVLIS